MLSSLSPWGRIHGSFLRLLRQLMPRKEGACLVDSYSGTVLMWRFWLKGLTRKRQDPIVAEPVFPLPPEQVPPLQAKDWEVLVNSWDGFDRETGLKEIRSSQSTIRLLATPTIRTRLPVRNPMYCSLISSFHCRCQSPSTGVEQWHIFRRMMHSCLCSAAETPGGSMRVFVFGLWPSQRGGHEARVGKVVIRRRELALSYMPGANESAQGGLAINE